jgi:hypothetical protein
MSWFEHGMFLATYPVCEWDCGLFGKVPRVQCGIVLGLERCPGYGVGRNGISFMESHAPIS